MILLGSKALKVRHFDGCIFVVKNILIINSINAMKVCESAMRNKKNPPFYSIGLTALLSALVLLASMTAVAPALHAQLHSHAVSQEKTSDHSPDQPDHSDTNCLICSIANGALIFGPSHYQQIGAQRSTLAPLSAKVEIQFTTPAYLYPRSQAPPAL